MPGTRPKGYGSRQTTDVDRLPAGTEHLDAGTRPVPTGTALPPRISPSEMRRQLVYLCSRTPYPRLGLANPCPGGPPDPFKTPSHGPKVPYPCLLGTNLRVRDVNLRTETPPHWRGSLRPRTDKEKGRRGVPSPRLCGGGEPRRGCAQAGRLVVLSQRSRRSFLAMEDPVLDLSMEWIKSHSRAVQASHCDRRPATCLHVWLPAMMYRKRFARHEARSLCLRGLRFGLWPLFISKSKFPSAVLDAPVPKVQWASIAR